MSKELVISSNRHETRVAILEDDQLVEVYFQRSNEYSLAGSIHKGRVTRVLPGMQSAFVDLGLERDTFLYVSDFFEEEEEYDQIPREREPRSGRDRERRPPREEQPARGEAPPPPAPAEAALDDEVPVATPVDNAEPSTDAAAESPDQEGTPIAAPAAATAAPPFERGNRGDRGDRGDDRNRRSRRRRNRGRGFPESKYASPSYAPTERPAVEPAEPVSAAEPSAPSDDFSVLPGESLAKYRHAAVPMLDSGEQEEIDAASAAAEHTLEQTIPEEIDLETAESQASPAADRNDADPVAESAPSAAVEAEHTSGHLESPPEEAEIDELLAEARAEAAGAADRNPEAETDAEAPAEIAQPAAVEAEAEAEGEAFAEE